MPRRAWLGSAAGLALLALFAALDADRRTLVTLPVVAGALLGLERHRQWSGRARALLLALLVLATAGFGRGVAETMRENLSDLPEWDFLGFWLHARSAVSGLSFYDPASARQLAEPFSVSPMFRAEIVDVGFWYPPPSMFLFWPLGWFEPPAALALWYGLQLAALAGCVFLLWRTFFPRGTPAELAACALLVCAIHGTLLTFYFSQTCFVALLALLLFWRRRATARGGPWIAVAFFVKPFLGVLALSPALGARWRVLGAAAATAAVLALAAAAAFGPASFADYLAGDHVGAKPPWIYSEPTNQSLLGVVLRATDRRCAGFDCIATPAFLAGVAVLGAVTLALGLGLRRAHDDWALSLDLLFVLLAYPVSQVFYSVLLVPLLLLVWRWRERLAGGAWSAALLAAAVYGLCALGNGRTTAAGVGLLWASMALVGARLIRGGGWPLLPARAATGPREGDAR